jgi:hypothetical protein
MLRQVSPRGHLTAALAAIVVAAAGCGGDDDGSAGDYRDEANAICRDAEGKIEDLGVPSSAEDLGRYLREGLEISREYNREFEALEPPSELGAEHHRLVELSRRAERLTEPLVDEVTTGDPAALKSLQRALPKLERIGRQSNTLARRMDLPDCVTPLTPPGAPPAPS